MSNHTLKTDIVEIINDKTMTVEQQASRLKEMREEVRAQMRADTEGGMIDNGNLGEDLKLLDEALKSLEVTPTSIEDGGAATL